MAGERTQIALASETNLCPICNWTRPGDDFGICVECRPAFTREVERGLAELVRRLAMT